MVPFRRVAKSVRSEKIIDPVVATSGCGKNVVSLPVPTQDSSATNMTPASSLIEYRRPLTQPNPLAAALVQLVLFVSLFPELTQPVRQFSWARWNVRSRTLGYESHEWLRDWFSQPRFRRVLERTAM